MGKTKIIHVIPSVDEKAGGPSKVVFEMASAENEQGMVAEIVTTNYERDRTYFKKNVRVISFKSSPGKFKYSGALKKWIENNTGKYDLMYIHGIFNYSSIIGSKIAIKTGTPFIMRPCGALGSYGLGKERLKKKIFLSLFFRRFNKGVFHFTTEFEKRESVKVKRSFILPLGIDVPSEGKVGKVPEFIKKNKVLLFLSRVDEKKGLEFLIPLLKHILRDDWVFVIAGNGSDSYLRKLKDIVRREEREIRERIHFVGFADSSKKRVLFRNSEIFVLPSWSENFANVVLESLAEGLPVAISERVGLCKFVEEHKLGRVFRMNEGDLSEKLKDLMEDSRERAEISKRCGKIIKRNFSWTQIIQEQEEIIKRILKKEL